MPPPRGLVTAPDAAVIDVDETELLRELLKSLGDSPGSELFYGALTQRRSTCITKWIRRGAGGKVSDVADASLVLLDEGQVAAGFDTTSSPCRHALGDSLYRLNRTRPIVAASTRTGWVTFKVSSRQFQISSGNPASTSAIS
jgi:hypothetical protein